VLEGDRIGRCPMCGGTDVDLFLVPSFDVGDLPRLAE
jgi:hypothetical protein